MDEKGFRKFLKRAGKKEHVVEGLIGQVQEFEDQLSKKRGADMGTVNAQDVREHAAILPEAEIKKRMRALSLYFQFTGKTTLSKLAHSFREERTAKTREVFKLRDFLGVEPAIAEKLEKMGVVTVEDMLAAGKTPRDRQSLALQTGIKQETILELVKLSDLSRLGAIKRVRARLYYEAGLDTPDKFTEWEPEALREMLVKFVERTGFDGIAPLPKEVKNVIATARKLPKVVEY